MESAPDKTVERGRCASVIGELLDPTFDKANAKAVLESFGLPFCISYLSLTMLPTIWSGGMCYVSDANARMNSAPPPETTKVLNPFARK
jgi:hypothetical protein